jgi:hypothetical protein
MNAKPIQYGQRGVAGLSNPQAENAFALLGAMPLAILAVEVVIGCILLLVSGFFFATIFFAFVGLILVYVALWIAVVFNAFGAAISLLTLLAGRRYITGKVFGISGLLIHVVLLGAGVYGLASIHNHLARAQSPLRQPATYSVPAQETRARIDQVRDWPTSDVPAQPEN